MKKEYHYKAKDPIYKELIFQVRKNDFFTDKEHYDLAAVYKIQAMRQFAEFNGLENTGGYHSLYELCDEEHSREWDSRGRKHDNDRTCFLKDGIVNTIVLHIPREDFNSQRFYRLSRKLGLQMFFISSFKSPKRYKAVVFQRKEEAPNKVVMKDKPAGLFKKLLKILSTCSWL